MSITKVNSDDLQIIENCGKKCLPIFFKQKELIYIINNPKFCALKIYYNDVIYGFIIIKILSDKNHIVSFCINPDYRRNGYGSLLINKIKELNKKKLITLNVQKNNKIAIEFYKKNGFKITKKLINYYYNLDCKDGYQMDYLYQCDII